MFSFADWGIEIMFTTRFLADRSQCIVIFPWVFLSTLLLRKWYGTWSLLYGIINLGLAIVVTAGVCMQAQFLPATSDGCKWGKAVTWQVVSGYPSVFTFSARLEWNDESKAEAMCKDLVGDWTIATTVV